MFDAADPVLARVREIALTLPMAREKTTFGRPTFFTGKTFATYSGGTKGAERIRYPQSVLFKPDADELPGLLADPRFFTPAYWGPAGWMGLDLAGGGDGDSPDAVDWTEVRELLDMSYRNTATKALVKQLDAQS